MAYPMALAGDPTALVGHDGASADTADIASYSADVREGSKPFLLVGSSLTALFAAGVMALAIILAVNFQPTVDRDSGETTVPPSVAPPPAMQSVPAAPPPKPVPKPAPAPPRPAPTATVELMDPPAPAPPVVVRNTAPAPAAPPRAPAAPPPVVAPPVIPPPPIIQLPIPGLPPIVLSPPHFNPRLQSPPWHPGPKKPPRGHGGSRHGHGDDD